MTKKLRACPHEQALGDSGKEKLSFHTQKPRPDSEVGAVSSEVKVKNISNVIIIWRSILILSWHLKRTG